MSRRPRVSAALARQMRDHAPGPERGADIALARSLAARLDSLELADNPAGAAALARVLSACLGRLAIPAAPDAELGRVLELVSTPIRDTAQP